MRLSELSTRKFIVLSVVVLLLSFGASYYYFILNTNNSSMSNSSTTGLTEKEIALIYIGCSECPAAQSEELPSLVEQLVNLTRANAIKNGYSFTSIGLSNEDNVQKGLAHLSSIIEFDEIALGNNMANTALQKYVWDKFDGPLSGAVPQVILSKRIFDTSTDSSDQTVYPSINSEEIIIRKVGVKGIQELLNDSTVFSSL